MHIPWSMRHKRQRDYAAHSDTATIKQPCAITPRSRQRNRIAAGLTAIAAIISAPVPADQQSLTVLASGRSYHVYGDILVPVEAGVGIQGAMRGSRWPQATLFYAFHSSVSSAHRNSFRTWLADWSNNSGVTFVESSSAQNRVLVQTVTSSGCGYSSVGMIGGVQDLGIACWNRGTVLHELGHALGQFHEHQRTDRNTYLNVKDNNIKDNCGVDHWNVNFGTVGAMTSSAYDYLSIMHYPSTPSFTCEGVSSTATLTVLRNQPPGRPPGSESGCTSTSSCQAAIGQRSGLSARDGYAMALHYGYRVRLQIDGNGSGAISSVSGHRDTCGTGCYLVSPSGAFRVSAVASPGSVATFSGLCHGRTCQFTPDENGVVRVRFTRKSSIHAIASRFGLPLPIAEHIFKNGFER